MIDWYISDSALQILSQLLVLGTYLSILYLFAADKRIFVCAGVLYSVISTVLVHDASKDLVLAVFFCALILFINRFQNGIWIVSATIGYLLVSNSPVITVFLIYFHEETLFYMMLKLVVLECAYYMFQVVYCIRISESMKGCLTFQSLIFSLCFGANFLLMLYNQNMQKGTRDILFFPVFVNTALYLAASFVLHVFTKNQKIQERLKIQQLKNELVNQQYIALKEKYEDISILKHDIKHHLQTLSILLHQGNVGHAKDYIDEVSGYMNKNSFIFTSANQMLEIVLNEKYLEAEKLGIHMEMNCKDVALDHINDMDIIAIFANVLDNAMEAASISDCEKRVAVSLAEKNHYVIFEVVNSYGNKLQMKNNHLQSTKKGHLGFGLISVDKAVKRYGGLMKQDYDGGIFKVTIFFPLQRSRRLHDNVLSNI